MSAYVGWSACLLVDFANRAGSYTSIQRFHQEGRDLVPVKAILGLSRSMRSLEDALLIHSQPSRNLHNQKDYVRRKQKHNRLRTNRRADKVISIFYVRSNIKSSSEIFFNSDGFNYPRNFELQGSYFATYFSSLSSGGASSNSWQSSSDSLDMF